MAKSEKTEGKIIGQEITVGPKQMVELLKVMVRDDVQIPCMLWGQPGIGKSDVCAQVAREEGRPFRDIRLLLLEPTDLRGIPYKNKDDEMVWAPAAMFPHDPNDRSIILLDEINAAPPSVQAAALQLVLNRRIGDYVLPKGVAIIAAGNRESDRTSVNRMPSALANRFNHFNMVAVFEDWREWAFGKGIHPDIVGFLSAFEKYLNTFDPALNAKAFATPRTWTYANKILNTDLPDHLKYIAIGGAVGDGVAGEFRRHRKFSLHLPKPDDILKGTVTKMPAECKAQVSMQYAMAVSLAYKLNTYYDLYKKTKNNLVEEKSGLTDKEWKKLAANFALFISNKENLDAEIAVMTLTTAYTVFNIPLVPKEVPELREFFSKYKDYFNSN